MATHYEQNLQRAIDLIREKILEMAELNRRALRDCLRALQERDRQIAYLVILRDSRIDELEKEIDRLCLEFLVRQQPVATHLRFAYATIKINLELERIGDYAESIARQALKLIARNAAIPTERFSEIAGLAIPMLETAIRAFVTQDAELARQTMATEEEVDQLRDRINGELFQLRENNKIPLEALTPMMTIARRFERVSDQAKNICQETLYICTGEHAKHDAADIHRLLFVDAHGSCRALMAEAIGNSLGQPKFIFAGAGLEQGSTDPETVRFLHDKGIDLSGQPRALAHVPNLDQYRIIVALDKAGLKAFPSAPTRIICLDWAVPDPSQVRGSAEEIRAAYEETYQFLRAQIHDLVEALLGEKIEKKEA